MYFIQVFFFVLRLQSIIAVFLFRNDGTIIDDEDGIFQNLSPEMRNALNTATSTYISDREDARCFETLFDFQHDGVIFLFELRLDTVQTPRVVRVRKDGAKLEVPKLNIEGPKKGFTYYEIPSNLFEETNKQLEENGGLSYSLGLQGVKNFINGHVHPALKEIGALQNCKSMGFDTRLIRGTAEDGDGTGLYAFVALIFTA